MYNKKEEEICRIVLFLLCIYRLRKGEWQYEMVS